MKLAVLLLAALAFGISGCTAPEPQEEPSAVDLPEWEAYEDRIQRPLFDLAIENVNPDRVGQIELESVEMIQVEIQLDPDQELPTGYLILEEGRAELGGSLTVQAYVRVDQLLELSQEPQILFLRAPIRPRR